MKPAWTSASSLIQPSLRSEDSRQKCVRGLDGLAFKERSLPVCKYITLPIAGPGYRNFMHASRMTGSEKVFRHGLMAMYATRWVPRT